MPKVGGKIKKMEDKTFLLYSDGISVATYIQTSSFAHSTFQESCDHLTASHPEVDDT